MLRNSGRDDQARRQHAEKALAAGIAAIRREAQKPFEGDECSLRDAVARDVLQIKISAARTMGVLEERPSHARGVEPFVAGTAAPRKQTEGAKQRIEQTAASRAETLRTAALWTNHPIGLLPNPILWRRITKLRRGSKKIAGALGIPSGPTKHAGERPLPRSDFASARVRFAALGVSPRRCRI